IYSVFALLLRAIGFSSPVPRSLAKGSVVPRVRIERFLEKRVCEPGPRYVWGGLEVPASCLAPHSLLSGSPGSGKSMCMLMLEKSALVPNGELLDHAVHFDPKQNAVPELVGMGVPLEKLRILNPFDARSRPVNLAADFTTESQARQLASLLVPKEKNSSQPFFTTAVQDLFAQVVVAFQYQKPKSWTLAEVLQSLRSAKTLREHLKHTGGGRDALAAYLSEPKLESHVMATVRSKMQVFETVAALWANSSNAPITLSEWVHAREPSVLVFGHDPVHDAVVGPINRALFLRLSQLLLGRPEATVTRPCWVFADELRLFGRLEGLQPLLFAGRSYQVRTALAFQDFEGLSSVWGPSEAGELIGQCGNVATFRLWNPATMELASRFYGDRIEWVMGHGTSTDSRGQTSSSENWSQQVRRLFLPSYFRNLPPPSPATGIPGVFTTPGLPVWSDPIPPDVVSKFLPSPAADVPGFVPRPPDDQSLGGTTPPPSAPPPRPPQRGFRTMDGHDLLDS
ncbi:MAG: type IV secretion system DNA-binding domain-containing protein, partial [Myxococcales bacterium]|nr:type IV secretion system DNA-binding domain-containing protein [Myxococcales bacterium]